ncbi:MULTISPECIES: hypothetical protein [unclassified Lysinibacillus]|uniref:hypothetical protein n=1 Tax=unclassified Lysinibacillus TaxID=2636778 RepID=UPI001170D955|nr:hypothetical protein [Lysinibacillus sp. CD3-6]QPQ35987.1 hypothetical protein JNUCC52_03400 [Lysinibacillus sp. JNUCC-52]UED82355.1 hypothetical protein FH508_0010780 [Lysinibacillus sp. CD3-6]
MDSQMSLLMEVHELIKEYSKMGDSLRHPENAIIGVEEELKLTDEEVKALKANEFDFHSICGIEKIVRDRMLSTFFHFFCIIDGVGDPKFRNDDTVWLGLKLEQRGLDEEREYEEFLHDMLYEAYWKWQEMKS